MSIDRQLDKKEVPHIYNEILLGHRKEILPFATISIDLGGIMLSEISQTEEDKTIWFHLFVEFENQNKPTNKRERNS